MPTWSVTMCVPASSSACEPLGEPASARTPSLPTACSPRPGSGKTPEPEQNGRATTTGPGSDRHGRPSGEGSRCRCFRCVGGPEWEWAWGRTGAGGGVCGAGRSSSGGGVAAFAVGRCGFGCGGDGRRCFGRDVADGVTVCLGYGRPVGRGSSVPRARAVGGSGSRCDRVPAGCAASRLVPQPTRSVVRGRGLLCP